MIGNSNLRFDPFFEIIKEIFDSSIAIWNGGEECCDPKEIELLDYPRWEAERGYWIGEYTFLQSDWDPFLSDTWNYPYDHHKGFIIGEAAGWVMK